MNGRILGGSDRSQCNGSHRFLGVLNEVLWSWVLFGIIQYVPFMVLKCHPLLERKRFAIWLLHTHTHLNMGRK